MKIAFLGSSEFSKIVLESLVNSPKHQVVCVVCNLDKPTGRGHKLEPCITKKFALEHNIPVLQYKSVSTEGEEQIKSFSPDALVTASFGQLLKENILNLAPYGVINVHSSLLPKYRGSCPVNWAIMQGESATGVTIMKTNIGLDTGDMILKSSLKIEPHETAGELTLRLAHLGAKTLLQALDLLESGEAEFVPQVESESSYYPMLSKELGKIDFNLTSQQICNKVRGLNPWPMCYVTMNNDKDEVVQIKVISASKYEPKERVDDFTQFTVGQVVLSSAKAGLIVKCLDGFVSLDVIKAPNSKEMPAKAYLNGRQIAVGTSLQ